jgi:hypothetical protein
MPTATLVRIHSGSGTAAHQLHLPQFMGSLIGSKIAVVRIIRVLQVVDQLKRDVHWIDPAQRPHNSPGFVMYESAGKPPQSGA